MYTTIMMFLAMMTAPQVSVTEEPVMGVAEYQQVIQKYAEAWNTTDEEKRWKLLSEVWAPQGAYIDPTVVVQGRKKLQEHIGAFLAAYPGATFELTGNVDIHNGYASFDWVMLDGNGNVALKGEDFGRFDNKGQLVQITGFFNASGL